MPIPQEKIILRSASCASRQLMKGFCKGLVCRNYRQKFRSGSKTRHYPEILGNQDYENLKFDLSPDGKAIAVGRAKRGNAEDIGLWVLQPETSPIPQRLLSRAAGEFA